ncbi:MAG: hypothetical protein HY741_05425 [Chloroflexi bacterium]|nr:hypothetical protein [Chloroflexota bacterium]
MKNMFAQWYKDERGVTALETAIILIAFVVVAAVFAFTILSTGTFMTERSKEAAFSGLAQVRGSVELKGSVIAFSSAGAEVDGVSFTLANVAGGQPIDFTPPSGATIAACTTTAADNVVTVPAVPPGNVINISARDSTQNVLITTWNVCSIGYSDGNNMLEDRELFKVWVPLDSTAALENPLAENTSFNVEVKPPSGAVLILQRLTPPTLEDVMDLQ